MQQAGRRRGYQRARKALKMAACQRKLTDRKVAQKKFKNGRL